MAAVHRPCLHTQALCTTGTMPGVVMVTELCDHDRDHDRRAPAMPSAVHCCVITQSRLFALRDRHSSSHLTKHGPQANHPSCMATLQRSARC